MKERIFRKNEAATSERIPKERKIRTKWLQRIVWIGIVFLSISGTLAFLQTQGIRVVVQSLNKEVLAIQKEQKKTARQSIALTPEIESFMNRFAALYMTISEDSETQTLRQETLIKEYYAHGLTENMPAFVGKRTLKSAAFVSLKLVEGVPTAIYKVVYVIETTKEEGEKAVEVQASQLLNIPFQASKVGCRVVSYPYFTALQENKEKADFLTYDPEAYETVEKETQNQLTEFLEDFLEKYAENVSKDMRYMMDDPEGLGGTAKVETVTSKIYQTEGVFVIKAEVTFQDKGTALLRQEHMTLEVIEKAEKFYVKKLTHTW